MATVAENLERKIHNVEIKTIKRTSNVCETSGNQFDIVSIMGNTKSGGGVIEQITVQTQHRLVNMLSNTYAYI